ncbi:MAG: hypothetical protein QOC56_1928 [Alphaproteobacteria bacterium]|nr:hypothetical protein [Alphaproteobacteria bacterium]
MANKHVLGSKPHDNSEWNSAWQAIGRLAAARHTALREIEPDERSVPAIASATDLLPVPDLDETLAGHGVAPDPEQYARAIAEIEQASAALRKTEPALETWPSAIAAAKEPRRLRSVWIVVGGIWLSTILVVAGAVRAIFYLFG